MHAFVRKFNEFQADRHNEEGKEQHKTKQVTINILNCIGGGHEIKNKII